MSIDNDKAVAINVLPIPSNRKELERFLGMTNYVAKFIQNYSDKSASLRQLFKKITVYGIRVIKLI